MQDVIQISSEAAVALAIAYFATVYAFGRLLLGQFERRANERDRASELLRKAEAQSAERELGDLRGMVRAESSRIGTLTENMNTFMRELPLEYVRREDYIMGQTVIVAKLDAIGSELKLVQIQGARRAN